MDIPAVILIILKVTHPVIRKTLLPNRAMKFQPMRKSTFDELHDPLQGNLRGRRQQGVDMIGHDNELMQKKFPLLPIMGERE